MVSTVNWETPLVPTVLLTTVLNSLANDTISAASAEFDNAAGLDTYAWLELYVTHAVAPSDSAPTLDIYMTRAFDSTNYETAPLTGGVGQAHMFVGSFVPLSNTSAQRLVFGPIPLPPCKVKFYLDNQTGQALAASGNTLKIAAASIEAQ